MKPGHLPIGPREGAFNERLQGIELWLEEHVPDLVDELGWTVMLGVGMAASVGDRLTEEHVRLRAIRWQRAGWR